MRRPMYYNNVPIFPYEYWYQHPLFSLDTWKKLVAEGATRLGYWAWVKNQYSEEIDEGRQ